ncbi:hypothetical protein R1flu_006167 [Riccia fluitans]|uniref:SPX domain-containing protein n=1 Tax=Riccia fluitans TaxID=41844 RepID=A0ABD1YVZ6_9MARC
MGILGGIRNNPAGASEPRGSGKSLCFGLDAQFNKVNHFFRGKEKEFDEQAQILEKQMQALVQMQKALEEYPDQFSASSKEKCGSSEKLSVTGNHSISTTDLEAGDTSLEAERHKEIS